jgi:hypothetical protein
MILAAIAIAIVVLAILIVHLARVSSEEQRVQSQRHQPDPKFTYRHGRTYLYERAIQAKRDADELAAAKRKQADEKAVELAAHRRRA